MEGLLNTYEPARQCTGQAQDGAKALMSWVLGAFGEKGARNLGIYNCRPIRGTNNTTSLHGEGRAIDVGFPIGDPDGDVLQELLQKYSGILGIQCIIYEREIWSGAHWDEGWRYYPGTNPHVDHLHIELSWHAANTLTAELIEQVLGGQHGSLVIIPPQVIDAKGPRLLRHGDRGDDVMVWQRELNRLGFHTGVDGIFLDETAEMTRFFQAAAGIGVDGVVGSQSRSTARSIPNFPGVTRHGMGSRRSPSPVTRAYQERLRWRGWDIAADGIHREGTSAILNAFMREKGLHPDSIGGCMVWTALFTRGGSVR